MECREREQLFIELDSNMLKGERYVLSISYNGELGDSLRGFYRSAYKTTEGKKRLVERFIFDH